MKTTRPPKIALIVSEFNTDITENLLKGAIKRLTKTHHVNLENLSIFKVPGAIEIPLTAKLIAKSKKYHALICLGAVIRGETDHYHYVCEQVNNGLQTVMLDFDLPVIFGILTTKTHLQAKQRSGGKYGNTGEYCADAAIRMIALKKELSI